MIEDLRYNRYGFRTSDFNGFRLILLVGHMHSFMQLARVLQMKMHKLTTIKLAELCEDLDQNGVKYILVDVFRSHQMMG